MEQVAEFERCVALLRGGDPAGATQALLSLRETPEAVNIARAVLARSTDGDALFHALALFRDGALKSWDARPQAERDAMCAAALNFARGEAARNAPHYVAAAAAKCFATLWARGYVDACAVDSQDVAVRRGRDAVVAVASSGDASIVAKTLCCLLAELSGTGRTHLGVARARRAAARHRFGAGGAIACGAVAFGLVSQAAGHARRTGAVAPEAAPAALLCESALSWDAGDAAPHARQAYPAVWRGRLDSCLDDCATLREVGGAACDRAVVASIRLLAAAAGPAVSQDEAGYRAAAARAAARVLNATVQQAGPPDRAGAADAFADVGQSAEVAAAAAAAGGGYGALPVPAAQPLLEAVARAADWASRACVEAAANATRETQRACVNRSDAAQIAAAQQAADDADDALDEGLAPVLEAWAHACTDASLVDADAAACRAASNSSGSQWLHAAVADVGAAVFARYASCRVEAARAQAACAILTEADEDASADDVEDSNARERLQTACAVGRRGVKAACGGIAHALQQCAPKLAHLENESDGVVVDATLEEARVLVAIAGALVADDDDAGETPEVPLAVLAAARLDAGAGAAVGAIVGAALVLVEATHSASPALATTLAWFLRRVAAAYAAPGVPEAFGGCPTPSQLARGAARAAQAWLGAWPTEPQTVRGAALLLGSLASARRGALASEAWAELQPLVAAHARSLAGGDDALTRAVARLAPARRSDLAKALADCALAVDATAAASNAFSAIIDPIEAVAQRCVAGRGDLELVLMLYRGVANAAAAQALDGPGATVARRRPADAVARALGPLVDACAVIADAALVQRCASCALSIARDAASAQLPYASRPAKAALLAAAARCVALCARGSFGREDEDDRFSDLGAALELVDRLVSYDVLIVDEEENESDSPDGVGAGLDCLSLIVPNLDEALLEGRSAAGARFFRAVAAVVDVAPDRLLERRDLAAGMAQALRFGAARADADAARAALHATRGLAARAAATDNYGDADAWLAAAGGVLRPLLEHRSAVWDRVDDAADAVLAALAASGAASRTDSVSAARAVAAAITENAPPALAADLEQLDGAAQTALRGAPTVSRALRSREARKAFRDACSAFLARAKGYLHTE